MHAESTPKQHVPDEPSTLDEIVALAPLSEEWWLAASNQWRSGKQVVSSEWELTKRALGATVLLWSCITAALGTFFMSLNVTAAYLLLEAEVPTWLVGLSVMLMNLMLIVLFVTTIKRVLSHINMKRTWAMLKGKNSLLDEEKDAKETS